MNRPLITEPGPAHAKTGTRRISLWEIDTAGGGYGDEARGTAYEAVYVSDDGHRCAVVAYYPIWGVWGWDVVEQTTIGLVEPPSDSDLIAFAEAMGATPEYLASADTDRLLKDYEDAIMSDLDAFVRRPSDSADVLYDYPHRVEIASLEEAQEIAERFGRRDISYALNLLCPEGSNPYD
jgi:hypothetical protein